ncbi:MAG: tRNA-intron lyase [Candidatus Micrarchaeia archaeon]
MPLELKYNSAMRKTEPADQSTFDILRTGEFGEIKDGKMLLDVEEVLYLLDVRNARCVDSKGKELSFNAYASLFSSTKKLMARYFTYKDWKDRGLIAKGSAYLSSLKPEGQVPVKRYPSSKLKLRQQKIIGTFFPGDMTAIIEDAEAGKELYEKYWIGQYGTYKVSGHGTLNKTDIFETLFLMENGVLSLSNYTKPEVFALASKWRPDFFKLFQIYVDWRSKGYVVKTGFKFGTHFRIYFPGANPVKAGGEWQHSKHVVHVFPRDVKMLISEWARAIRVAHSVRKTFILAIPGKSRKKKLSIDFVLFHRKGGNIEKPGVDKPKYAMLSLSENEYIGGSELSAIINEAKQLKLELVMAIADRETAVTYYKARRIELPGSEYEYYEIDWIQP